MPKNTPYIVTNHEIMHPLHLFAHSFLHAPLLHFSSISLLHFCELLLHFFHHTLFMTMCLYYTVGHSMPPALHKKFTIPTLETFHSANTLELLKCSLL